MSRESNMSSYRCRQQKNDRKHKKSCDLFGIQYVALGVYDYNQVMCLSTESRHRSLALMQ